MLNETELFPYICLKNRRKKNMAKSRTSPRKRRQRKIRIQIARVLKLFKSNGILSPLHHYIFFFVIIYSCAHNVWWHDFFASRLIDSWNIYLMLLLSNSYGHLVAGSWYPISIWVLILFDINGKLKHYILYI